MITYGICYPTTLMTLFVLGVFFISAVAHPREFSDILYIVIYYLLIPSTYLLLTIYALCNLNDISWGTREVAPTAAAKQREEARKLQVRDR